MQYQKDKKGLWELIENHSAYQHMNADTLEVVSILLNIPKLWENQAIRELFADARNEGLIEGISQGIQTGLEEKTSQIIKNMLNRNMSDTDIMAIAECTQETIAHVRNTML